MVLGVSHDLWVLCDLVVSCDLGISCDLGVSCDLVICDLWILCDLGVSYDLGVSCDYMCHKTLGYHVISGCHMIFSAISWPLKGGWMGGPEFGIQ